MEDRIYSDDPSHQPASILYKSVRAIGLGVLASLLVATGCRESAQHASESAANSIEQTNTDAAMTAMNEPSASTTQKNATNSTIQTSEVQLTRHEASEQTSTRLAAEDSAPEATGAGPGGRSLTRPPKLKIDRSIVREWPRDAEKREIETHATNAMKEKLLSICTLQANENGKTYLADENSAYELTVPGEFQAKQPVVKIIGERLRYDPAGIGSLSLRLSAEFPEVIVRSKPANFEKLASKTQTSWSGELSSGSVTAEHFPFLLPWSEPTAFPKLEFVITYREGLNVKDPSIDQWGKAGAWLNSLRFLDQLEKIKLLNLDQLEVLPNAAKQPFQDFKKRLPRMFGQRGHSLIVLQQHLFDDSYRLRIPTGGESSTWNAGKHRLLEALRANEHHEYKDFSGIYPISEIPGGQCQIWLAEDGVSEIDRLNGIGFRGILFYAVRGYERGRYFKVWKWEGTKAPVKVKLADGWGDWVKPATRVGAVYVTIDDGKVAWKQPDELDDFSTPDQLDLDSWCFTKAEKDRLLGMLDTTDEDLREQAKWPALPF